MSAITDELSRLHAEVKRTVESPAIQQKRQKLAELIEAMSSPAFWDDQKKAAQVSQLASQLQKEVGQWQELEKETAGAVGMAAEADTEEAHGMQDDLSKQAAQLTKRFRDLELTLFLAGKYDDHGAVISIYAGAGGVDAQDWAAMLLRMYLRLAERRSWKATVAEKSAGTEAGLKSVTMEIEGPYAFGYLQGEHGVHRLIRLSPFDADHARHTSFAMVEVLPAVAETEIEVRDEDLKIETKTASGHGGQSVNTTYSAVRIVHVPTGITVQCQDERSQLQNKERALRLLRGKLQRYQDTVREEERLALRGERTEAAWGNQVRTYVLHPYRQVREHRSDYEESDPDAVLNGELDGFIEHYLRHKAPAT